METAQEVESPPSPGGFACSVEDVRFYRNLLDSHLLQKPMQHHPTHKVSEPPKYLKPHFIDLDTYEEESPNAVKVDRVNLDTCDKKLLRDVKVEEVSGPSEKCHSFASRQQVDNTQQSTSTREQEGIANLRSSESVNELWAGANVMNSNGFVDHVINVSNNSSPAVGDKRSEAGNEPVPPSGEKIPRWKSSTVGNWTVQCARCFKWRLVPSKEQYEAIREHISERPWFCENAVIWRSDAHCNVPTDLNQDSNMLWAIDKPNLPSSPPGWQRKVIVRKDCSTKFADVYYTAPDGKTLRSMVEVGKYISEHPDSVPKGTSLNQFSFTIPQPLPGVWAKKRNPMRSFVSPSSPQVKSKRARAPQPLARKLAHRLLHGSNPPSLPMAPSASVSAGPSLGQPSPIVPPHNVSIPSFASLQSPYGLHTMPPSPYMRNSYHQSSAIVGSQTQILHQVPHPSASREVISSPSSVQPNPSSPTPAARRNKQHQKSRLGVATSLSQNLILPAILPLRDPSSE